MQPFVTVILPIRNEAKHIERCLEAVLAQDYPAERMEIFAVDGMSDDGTRAIVARILGNIEHIRVRMLDNPGRIVPTAMNLAIGQARGDVIIRIDGHTIIAPDYVRACVEALQASDAACVGGPMVARGQGPFGDAVALATSHPFGVGGSRFHYASEIIETDSVYLGAYRRDVFSWAGYFDEEMVCNQDDEFNYRLRAKGAKIVLHPSIRSVYHNRSTVKSLWRQYFRYGVWKVRVAQKVPRQMRPRHFIPFAFVAVLLGGALLAPFFDRAQWAWLVIVSVYAGSNLGISLMIASRTGWQHFILLPPTFSILHIAYGAGFAVGLIRLAKFQK
jgi:cellulose synthase/poly-beta-1,6-N-acetylglucosamine synthase-like glycosyltransferase